MTDVVGIAGAVKEHVNRLGGGWMLSDEAKALGKSNGVGGWATYMIGRGGVLGDVHPDVVTAAFHFVAPGSVRTAWTKARALMTPDQGATAFAGVCHAWARRHLADARDLDRLAELLATAVDAVPLAGAPVAAGWRAMPLPDDAPARVVQLSHVLREYRGAVHGMCCLASGLTPLQAVLTGGGESSASLFGWEPPYDDVSGLAAQRAAAEELTTARAATPWAALSHDERAEVVTALTAASQVAAASLSR